jgi:GntR family transcriptional repressor for pyruvate dehydrogenase complex
MISPTSTQQVFERMLRNVQAGVWETGSTIPSERSLIEEFGVSRIAIREALSMLRGLGVLDISHGRRTRVRPVDSETLGHLLPLMLISGGQRTFDQVFEVRLAIESQSAALAARRRTPEQLESMRRLVDRFKQKAATADPEVVQSDLNFHMEVARASHNPLFPILLKALAGFITFAQRESCRDDPVRRQRAVLSHEAIVDAIEDADSDRARVEMEAHLRYSMTRRIEDTAPTSSFEKKVDTV